MAALASAVKMSRLPANVASAVICTTCSGIGRPAKITRADGRRGPGRKPARDGGEHVLLMCAVDQRDAQLAEVGQCRAGGGQRCIDRVHRAVGLRGGVAGPGGGAAIHPVAGAHGTRDLEPGHLAGQHADMRHSVCFLFAGTRSR